MTLYKLSQCKAFYQRVKVFVVKHLRSLSKSNFLHFLESCAMYARLWILSDDIPELILPHIQLVKELTIEMILLKPIAENCGGLVQLKIYLSRVNFAKYSDFDPNLYFQCIEKFSHLKALHIQGIRPDRFLWVSNLLRYANILEEVYLENLNVDLYNCDYNKYNSQFREAISSASHISHWKLKNVAYGQHLLQLPASDISLALEDDSQNIDFQNTRILSLSSNKRHHLYNQSIKYNHLRKLELYDMNLNVFGKGKLPCPKLKVLKLSQTLSTKCFLLDFIPIFKSSLKELILENVAGINEEIINYISQECSSLEKLTLRDCVGMTRGTLYNKKLSLPFDLFVDNKWW